MYSVRLTTKAHGITTTHLFLFIVSLSGFLTFFFGWNYAIIFCASSLLHVVIETSLHLLNLRKGEMFYGVKKIPKFMEILLRSMVEGPAFCVPAFFVADQFILGPSFTALFISILVVGGASFYLGWFDRKHVNTLVNESDLLVSRRAMLKPKAVISLAFINSLCLIAIMLIPSEHRNHAFIYYISYAGFVLLFYFINFNLGVRYIEVFNADTKLYEKPKISMQVLGLVYDSAYEMTLIVSPAYWICFYLGFFV